MTHLEIKQENGRHGSSYIKNVTTWKRTEKLNQSEIIRMGKIKTNRSVHVDNKILHNQT